MSDTTIEAVAAGGAERGPPRKRRRLVVSCTECHRRKQKVITIFFCLTLIVLISNLKSYPASSYPFEAWFPRISW